MSSDSPAAPRALAPFHLAVPVHDLAAARGFYGGLFGCPEGRSSAEWVDFDFFGLDCAFEADYWESECLLLSAFGPFACGAASFFGRFENRL